MEDAVEIPQSIENLYSPGEMMTFFPVVLPSLLCSLHLAPIVPRINSWISENRLGKSEGGFCKTCYSLRNFAAFPPKQK